MLSERGKRIMDGLREYVIHLCATALLCTVLLSFTRGTGTVKMILKLLCGIVLAYSVISPLKQLQIPQFDRIISEFQEEASVAMRWGQEATDIAIREGISQGAEAYILEKAKALNLDLLVEVELSDDEIPVPAEVSLIGNAAPYAKTVLGNAIWQDLNIPKEKQIWISR